jgi:hypothetical protein
MNAFHDLQRALNDGWQVYDRYYERDGRIKGYLMRKRQGVRNEWVLAQLIVRPEV